ncbi:hypothetical protein PR048_010168 [Dryococelus australis]|uniref:Integrase catalytic domain-containing protein n=1 Tax=Dryococelus australis TaxID=614101 RepID=A0ABQ9I211_9NEOP|nr:hypothetical protein PR048_010168 [Dryococelus australis]
MDPAATTYMQSPIQSPTSRIPCTRETLLDIETCYSWNGMSSDVRQHVNDCVLCCHGEACPVLPPKVQPRRPKMAWTHIAAYLIRPYPWNQFSRWVEAFLLPSQETTPILWKMETRVFSRWGYPKAVLTDNGTQFTSR